MPAISPPESGITGGTGGAWDLHTGYQPDRVDQRPAAQGHPQPRPVPLRTGRPQSPLPGRAESGGVPPPERRDPQLGVETGASGVHDLLRGTNPDPMKTATIT